MMILKRFRSGFIIVLLLLAVSRAAAFQSVVILPFINESDQQEIYWLGEGFAESLSEEMLFHDAYLIQRPEKKAAYDELRLPYIGELSRATMLKVGEKLGVDYVVFGAYKLINKELRVEVKAIRIPSMQLSEPIVASGALDHLYQVQDTIREGLKKYFISEKFAVIEEKPQGGVPVPLHAYELYIKGLLESSDNEKIKFFQRALETHRDYPQALYRLGLALMRLQRNKESNYFLKRITSPGAFQSRSDFLIGLNLYSLRDYDGAYQKWLDLSKRTPTAEVYNNVGLALMRKNDFQGAEWYLSQAVNLDPINQDYHFNLAGLYVQKKSDQFAEQQFREVVRLDPNDYQALFLLAKLLEKQENPAYKKMTGFFQETLPSDQRGKFPEQYNSYLQLLRPSTLLYLEEERQYFAASNDKVLKQRMTFVRTYQENARGYLEREEPDKAVLEIRKGISLSPMDYYLHYLLGIALIQQKNMILATPELQFAIWCKDNADSHAQLAEIYRQDERYADAKVQVQQCLALDPKNKKALEIWNKIWDKD